MNLILVVGAPRSGTTLLQTLIACHPQVCTAPETHFFARLTSAALYERNLPPLFPRPLPPTLTHDAAEHYLAGRSRNPEQGPAYWEARLPAGDPLDIRVVADVFFESFKTDARQTTFLEKSPPHVFFIPQIRQAFPEARIVNIVRDPRDVVVSFNRMLAKKNKQPRPIHEAAMVWERSVRAAAGQDLYTIRYEELVADKEAVLADVYRHLELDFSPSMLEHYDAAARDSVRDDEIWKQNNLAPVNQAGQGGSRSALTEPDNALIEGLCSAGMQRYGYDCTARAPIMRVLAARIAFASYRVRRLLGSLSRLPWQP